MQYVDQRSTIIQRPERNLLKGLGSFWNEQFQDRAVVEQVVRATGDLFRQADIDMKERLLIARDRAHAPLYHRQLWWRVEITMDDLVVENPNVPAYDPDGPVYSPDNLFYGQGVPQLWVFSVPKALEQVRCLVNQVVDPSFIAYQGGGLFHRPGFIGLTQNPLATDTFEKVSTDRGTAAVLWFYQSDWSQNTWNEYYAIPLQSAGPPREYQRSLVDGLWSARIQGPSWSNLYKVVTGCTGVPLCRSDNEIVEYVQSSDLLRVVTDKHVYAFPGSHSATVSVGDVLREGQSMTDALDLVEMRDIASSGYPILLPPEFFPRPARIQAPLLFPNETVPVVDGGLDVDGNRIVEFDIYGDPEDVERYLRYGAQVGLYRAFDKRGPNAPTQPLPQNLINTINPAVLVASHLAPKLILLVGDRRQWPAPAAYQEQLPRHLASLVPPHGRVIIQDLEAVAEALSYSSS